MKKIILNSFMRLYPKFHTVLIFTCAAFLLCEAFVTAKIEAVSVALVFVSILDGSSYLGKF